jgi:hypothetical protein
VLFNWNLLGNGMHLVEVLDSGTVFASANVTVATFGTEFLTGQSGTLTGTFAGRQITVQWSEAAQNFIITNVGGSSPGGQFSGTYNVNVSPGENTCTVFAPIDLQDALVVEQEGNTLTATAVGGTAYTGTVDGDGDFVLSNTPEISTPSSGCTLAVTTTFAGSFVTNQVDLTFVSDFTGSCSSLDRDCQSVYSGALARQ